MAGDSFLSDPSRKRKRGTKLTSTTKSSKSRTQTPVSRGNDSDLSSDLDGDPGDVSAGSGDEEYEKEEVDIGSDEEFAAENAADKRRRLAKQYLENLKTQELDGDFDAADLDEDNLAKRLQEDVAETKGHVYKFIADKIESQLEQVKQTTTRIGSRNLTGVAVRHPYIYTVSKDMELIKWTSGKSKPQRIKHTKGGRRFATINTHNQNSNHHWDQINCVAASPDGKFVVTGGSDARLIIWSSENLACLKVLETRAAVNALCFRRGTDQLYAACADLRIRTFSINQFAQLEILYGHQDNITDISALGRETCVSVGSRDKTAMFWKIAEESRLTFRGGDSSEKRRRKNDDEKPEAFHAEGSIEAVSMLDESHFITGSDNGNVALWALSKKKALFTQRLAHGLLPQFAPTQASAETKQEVAERQIPERQPYWITAVYAVPYSDFFVTGSYSGQLKVWKVERGTFRSFSLVGEVQVKGCVVKIDGAELHENRKLVIYAVTSKEHKLGRWLGKIEGGRNTLTSLTFDI